MKKIINFLLCSACILTFALSLSGCGKSDEEADSNNTTITDNQKKEPEKINILVNADYLENFKTSFADTTYFNQKMSHACVHITISKKTDFIIRNIFKLTLQVSKYIDLEFIF